MPTIVMSRTTKVEPTHKKKAYAFLEKLSEDDTLAGLHIEPIKSAADKRVRTGRVDDGLRAVLFKLAGEDDSVYILEGIYEHDKAIEIAQRRVLTVNPSNGVTEIRHVEAPAKVTGEESEEHAQVPPAVVPAEVPAAGSLLERYGRTLGELAELGIEPELAARAMAAASEDELLELVKDRGDWQAEAIVELACGRAVAEVRETLGLEHGAVAGASEAADVVDDAAVLQGTKVPAAAMSFAYIEDNQELRRVIEQGDFGVWRVFLHPEQRRYVDGNYKGPYRLSGGAGTGKTVVLLHRARRLARDNPKARIVLTTFNRTLAAGLIADLRQLDPDLPLANRLGEPGIMVAGIDQLADEILRRAHPARLTDLAEQQLGMAGGYSGSMVPRNAWNSALQSAGSKLREKLRSDAFLRTEYEMVFLPQYITQLPAYLRARRAGRGVSLNRADRMAVWEVVSTYRTGVRNPGELDFAEKVALATGFLDQGSPAARAFQADHVLVDEGQDLSPMHWKFLRALAIEGANDLFIAEDSQQRIYGHKVRLSDYGIAIVGRARRLTLNYRTTAQNLHFALAVLAGVEHRDLEDEVESNAGYRSARSGPKPRAIGCRALREELDAVAGLLRGWIEAGVAAETIGLLTREREQRERLVRGLADRGVDVAAVERGMPVAGKPQAMTMHRAKGLEFSRVVLFGVSDRSIPAALRQEEYSEESMAEALGRERSLLYVAATRARDELVVTYSGEPSGYLP